MRRIVAATLLFCLLAGTAGGILITEFCPDPYLPNDPDEYLVLEGEGVLDGYTISDGEGKFRFPPGTRINGRLVVAGTAPRSSRPTATRRTSRSRITRRWCRTS